MATPLQPKLDVPTRGTLPNLTKVRKVIIPRGTRVVVVSSTVAFYLEVPAADKADDAAETPTVQILLPAGAYPFPIRGNGESDIPTRPLDADTAWYFVPTSAGQDISVWPRSVL